MTANLLRDQIFQRLSSAWPMEAWCDTTVVVGVSGGPDSVALLRSIDELKRRQGGAGKLVVAHFDHRWRSGSPDDAEFVRRLAKDLQLEFRLGVNDSNARDSVAAVRSEDQARRARYEFLLRSALETGARFVAVGHTADDQVETIVHHFVRGSGLRGLSGMSTARPLHEAVTLVRPLLQVDRHELVELLQMWQQPFRQDPTNDSSDFTRVRIRKTVIPTLKGVYADADRAIVRLGNVARETSEFLASIVDPILSEAIIKAESHKVVLDLARLRREPPLLIRESLMELWRNQSWPRQAMGYNQWNLLVKLVHSIGRQSENFPAHLRASTDGSVLQIWRISPEAREDVRTP